MARTLPLIRFPFSTRAAMRRSLDAAVGAGADVDLIHRRIGHIGTGLTLSGF
jgi:hypothetical protein